MEAQNDTPDPNRTAGSPVLGSSTFKRKFFKNKGNTKKAKLRLSDRFRDELLVSDGNSNATKSLLEQRTEDISLNCDVEALKEQDASTGICMSSRNLLSINKQDKNVAFQTASGKPLCSKRESSDFANKLMSEFLNPVVIPSREKKYNFLSRDSSKRISNSIAVKCDYISNFLGFEEHECRCSLEISDKFHKIMHTLSVGITTEKKDYQKSQDRYRNQVLTSEINGNLCDAVNNKTSKVLKINSEMDISISNVIESKNNATNVNCVENKISNRENSKIFSNVGMDFPQFSTASGKTIVISSDRLSKINSIFKDIPDLPDASARISSGILSDSSMKDKIKNNKIDSVTIGNSEHELNKINRTLETECNIVNFKNSCFNECVEGRNSQLKFSLMGTASGNSIESAFCEQSVVPNNETDSIEIRRNGKEQCIEDGTGLTDMKTEDLEKCAEKVTSSFSTASGKTIELPSKGVSRIDNIFKDISDFSDVKPKFEVPGFSGVQIEGNGKGTKKVTSLFSTASGKTIKLPSTGLSGVDKIFKDIPDFNDMKKDIEGSTDMKTENLEKFSEKVTSSFSTASGKTIELPSTGVSRTDTIFKDISDFSDMKPKFEGFSNVKIEGNEKNTKDFTSLFSTASGKTIKLPSTGLSGIESIFKDVPDFAEVKTNFEASTALKINKISNSHVEVNNATKNSHTPLRKSCIDSNYKKSSEFETNRLDSSTKAEEDDSKNYITPQRSLPKKRRLGSSLSKKGSISDVAMNKAKSLFGDMNFDDLKLPSHMNFGNPILAEGAFTPKKTNLVSAPQYSSTPIRSFSRNDSFSNEVCHITNQRFSIQRPNPVSLKDLEVELQKQKSILEKELEFVTRKHETIRKQIDAESSNKRFKLEPQAKKNKISLKDVRNMDLKSNCVTTINNSILQINPQNAVLLHFNNNWHEVPTVTTEDGCVLVPNKHGSIGISEIEPAFSSMQGVEFNLIPKGWIKNHYRWIVWKLASYERFFPATLGGCLTVDNVIKQLKYRYLRELYNAERPALRRIYEKDDIPQKRMVLCISNIIKNIDNSELELTDGWYHIRAIVDEPLCFQINNKKLKIGTKLMISGAEVLNCEGCHPLEVEEARKVRLKIYFNSTRRAAWFSKLGYQKDPSPLPIKLSSAIWNGGNIGRITVYVMRIYPVIYREKTESNIYWRNKNAEYKTIQEHENEYMKRYEENNNANMIRRNVCSLLQMTVIDVSEAVSKPYKCTIWDSNESHQELLKENRAVTCYNLTLRCNGELSCTKKSYFQVSKHDTLEYEKYRRKYVEISSYQAMIQKSAFGEFDTIGFILKMHTEEKSQYLWLTDLRNNFLLVKINEGPNHCLLLNKVEEEYLVAVCNLTLSGSQNGFVIATAGFHTIVTQYPQYDFLRIKMEELGNVKRDDIKNILVENKKKIDTFENVNTVGQTSTHSNESEGNSLNFSRATSTDAVMSMINIDEIVNKHTM